MLIPKKGFIKFISYTAAIDPKRGLPLPTEIFECFSDFCFVEGTAEKHKQVCSFLTPLLKRHITLGISTTILKDHLRGLLSFLGLISCSGLVLGAVQEGSTEE